MIRVLVATIMTIFLFKSFYANHIKSKPNTPSGQLTSTIVATLDGSRWESMKLE